MCDKTAKSSKCFFQKKTSNTLVFFIELHFIQCSTENLSLPLNLSHSYDSEGRLTNVTFPTGVVTSLGYDMETVSTVERESFERDEAATMTTNQSAIQSVLALQQGNLFTLNGACVLWGIECTLENAKCKCFADQLKNNYVLGYDHSFWILYANGMSTHFQTEPHILSGASSPTLACRNMTLPDDSGQNLVEWRFRKEQTRTKVTVFGRKLRVRTEI